MSPTAEEFGHAHTLLLCLRGDSAHAGCVGGPGEDGHDMRRLPGRGIPCRGELWSPIEPMAGQRASQDDEAGYRRTATGYEVAKAPTGACLVRRQSPKGRSG